MYDLKSLKQRFGDKITHPENLIVTTHREASGMLMGKTHREIGVVPDASLDEKGTMVLLERLIPKEAPPVVAPVVAKAPQIAPAPKRIPVLGTSRTLPELTSLGFDDPPNVSTFEYQSKVAAKKKTPKKKTPKKTGSSE